MSEVIRPTELTEEEQLDYFAMNAVFWVVGGKVQSLKDKLDELRKKYPYRYFPQFYVNGGEIIAVPFTKKMREKYPDAIAESGKKFDREKLWNYVKPEGCDKPYNYYPGGRIVSNKPVKSGGATLVYTNPVIDFATIRDVVKSLNLGHCFDYIAEFSDEYKCYLDERQELGDFIGYTEEELDYFEMNGLFWVVGGEVRKTDYDYFEVVGGKIIAVLFTEEMRQKYPDAIAESGKKFDREKLWDYVKPEGCDKPYNYYPGGRVVGNIPEDGHDEIFIHANPATAALETILDIVRAFGLGSRYRVTYEYGDEYKCYLDERQELGDFIGYTEEELEEEMEFCRKAYEKAIKEKELSGDTETVSLEEIKKEFGIE